MKWFGVLLIVLGVLLIVSGVRDWSKPPIQDPKWYYGTSRQMVDLGVGVMFAAIGLFVYRTGRWPR